MPLQCLPVSVVKAYIERRGNGGEIRAVAKIILYLHAANGQSAGLIDSAGTLASHPFLEKHQLQLAVTPQVPGSGQRCCLDCARTAVLCILRQTAGPYPGLDRIGVAAGYPGRRIPM